MSLNHTLRASALMVLTFIFLYYIGHAEAIHPNQPFSSFPKQIGEWRGKESFFDEKTLTVLGVDDYFLGSYLAPDSFWIHLYVGFYQSQSEGDQIHSPKNCMPGAGWNIIRTELEELDIPGNRHEKTKVIKLLLQKGEQKQVMLYWFQAGGRIIASEYMQKIYMVIDSITRHRTDGSFVRLIAPVIGNDEETSLIRLKSFAGKLMPILHEYIPS